MEAKKDPEIIDADQAIREYYERDTTNAFRDDLTEPVSTTRPAAQDTGRSPELSGGDVDAALDQADVGAETVSGHNPTPDQDVVEELGKAAGVTYEDTEPLKFGDKVTARDDARWELDPASSEDYAERAKPSPDEPSATPPPSPSAPAFKRRSAGKKGGASSASSKRRPPS